MIHHGDCLDVLRTLPESSVDACVTDPPYGIGFMGREWDTFKPGVEQTRIVPNRNKESDNPNLKGRTRGPASSPSAVEYDRSLGGQRAFQAFTEGWAREVLRVLKPGAYCLVFAAPRSYHRMACGLEDAGFVVRDCLSWLFGSGFPKNMNLGNGKGTALKPAHEPIGVAWKPFKGSITACHAEHGTAALNIDACRIESGSDHAEKCASVVGLASNRNGACYGEWAGERENSYNDLGRWPANVILDEAAAAQLDEMTGELVSNGQVQPWSSCGAKNTYGQYERRIEEPRSTNRGGASRFFYVAKPSREERDFGCYSLPQRSGGEATDRIDGSAGLNNPRAGAGRTGGSRNSHPTVKPVELMRWLVRLVTPPNGTVLDPFLGSGTTGMACRYEHREFIGIEREADYIKIAERRIAAVAPLFAEEHTA